MSNGPLTIGRVVNVCSAAEEVLKVCFGTTGNPADVYGMDYFEKVRVNINNVSVDQLINALFKLYHASEGIKNAEFPGGK